MEEKRYRIEEIKSNLEEDKKIIPAISTTAVVYAAASALLLYFGVDKIVDGQNLIGSSMALFGASFAVSDAIVIASLKEVIEQHINEKEELNNLGI